jgi:hypothetical protein
MQVELQRGAVYALYGVGVAQAIAGVAFFVWIAT